MSQFEILIEILWNPNFLIGCLLIVFLPWRWLLRLLALVCVSIWLFPFLLQPPVYDPGPGFALGLVFIAINVVALLIILALRSLYQLIRHLRKPSDNPATPPPFIDRIIATTLGISLGVALLKTLSRVFQGAGHGYAIHASLALAAIILGTLALWKLRGNLRALLVPFAATITALSLWGVTLFPASVRDSAMALAGSNPYCVALQTRMRPVASLEDLTFLTMDKSFGHHAILLVDTPEGRQGFHWSYFNQQFNEGMRFPSLEEPQHCQPRPDFFATLAAEDATRVQVTIDGATYAIPPEWQPHLSAKYIGIAAGPPDFAPGTLSSQFNPNVEFGSAGWLEPNLAKIIHTEPDGPELYGLRINQNSEGPRLYALHPDGSLATSLNCGPDTEPDTPCQHRFTRGNDLYTIYFPRHMLADWQKLETAFVARIESFRLPD